MTQDQMKDLGTALHAIGMNITSEYIHKPEEAIKYLQ
jgi:hypothetical protein